MEVKPAEFARMAGVSRQSVYSKIKNHTLIVNAAGLLDSDNPLNSRYMADQRRKVARVAPAQLPAGPGSGESPSAVAAASYPTVAPPPILRTDQDIAAEAGIPQELLGLTIRELVLRYNGIFPLERHAKILKDLTMASEKDQRMQERGLKVISKDFVSGTLISYQKNLSDRLLAYPDSAAEMIIAKVQSHGADSRPEIITELRIGIGKIIAGAKEQIIQDLNSLRGKYQTGEVETQESEKAEGTSD